MVERLFLAVPRGCLRFVIVVFPEHTHLLFLLFMYHVCRAFLSVHAALWSSAEKGLIFLVFSSVPTNFAI